jgi:hypothetical protein
MTKTLNHIDLFTGVGRLSEGFKRTVFLENDHKTQF